MGICSGGQSPGSLGEGASLHPGETPGSLQQRKKALHGSVQEHVKSTRRVELMTKMASDQVTHSVHMISDEEIEPCKNSYAIPISSCMLG